MNKTMKTLMQEKGGHGRLLEKLKRHFIQDEKDLEDEDDDDDHVDMDDDLDADDEGEKMGPLKTAARLFSKKRYVEEKEEDDDEDGEEIEDVESQMQPGFPAQKGEFGNHMRMPKPKRKEMAVLILAKKIGKKHGKGKY